MATFNDIKPAYYLYIQEVDNGTLNGQLSFPLAIEQSVISQKDFDGKNLYPLQSIDTILENPSSNLSSIILLQIEKPTGTITGNYIKLLALSYQTFSQDQLTWIIANFLSPLQLNIRVWQIPENLFYSVSSNLSTVTSIQDTFNNNVINIDTSKPQLTSQLLSVARPYRIKTPYLPQPGIQNFWGLGIYNDTTGTPPIIPSPILAPTATVTVAGGSNTIVVTNPNAYQKLTVNVGSNTSTPPVFTSPINPVVRSDGAYVFSVPSPPVSVNAVVYFQAPDATKSPGFTITLSP